MCNRNFVSKEVFHAVACSIEGQTAVCPWLDFFQSIDLFSWPYTVKTLRLIRMDFFIQLAKGIDRRFWHLVLRFPKREALLVTKEVELFHDLWLERKFLHSLFRRSVWMFRCVTSLAVLQSSDSTAENHLPLMVWWPLGRSTSSHIFVSVTICLFIVLALFHNPWSSVESFKNISIEWIPQVFDEYVCPYHPPRW